MVEMDKIFLGILARKYFLTKMISRVSNRFGATNAVLDIDLSVGTHVGMVAFNLSRIFQI